MYPGTSVQCKAKQQQQLQNCGSFDLIEGYRNFVTVHTCRLLLNIKKLKTRYSDGRRQLKPQRTIAGWGQGH